MTTDVNELLRSLGSGVHGARAGGGAAPIGSHSGLRAHELVGGDFKSLLDRARRGSLTSGEPVSIAPGTGVELSADQLTRIAAAADVAQASGISRALVLIDGVAVQLDVGTRSVTGIVDLQKTAAVGGIDGVVQAPASGSGAASVVEGGAARPLASGSQLLKSLTTVRGS